jgi:hypothetical protein
MNTYLTSPYWGKRQVKILRSIPLPKPSSRSLIEVQLQDGSTQLVGPEDLIEQ